MAAERVVLVGVGQIRNKPDLDGPFRPVEPARLMASALQRAVDDSGVPSILEEADFLGTVAPIAWRYPDTPGRVAELIGASPREQTEPPLGGESPVMLLNSVARAIREGEIRIALLTGADTLYGRRRAKLDGVSLDDWGSPDWNKNIFEGQRPIANAIEMRHGLFAPIHAYPLFENALRAESGRGIDDHQQRVAELMARYSAVAVDAPASWFPEARTAAEIREVTPSNRWICFPYTKLMNAIMLVDQGAACVVMSEAEADRLEVAPEKRVAHIGGARAVDAWTPTERLDFVSSPGYRAAAEKALEHAAIDLDCVDLFDLYSCFPSAVELVLKELDLSWDDPRGFTVTGGLAHHGGPGNNYSMHAIANMVRRLRLGDGRVGWVSGLGMTATKHVIAVLATDPARIAAADAGITDLELPPELVTGPELVDFASGAAEVETYTVEFDREGRPHRSVVVLRLEDGRRTVAQGEPTPLGFSRLLEQEGVGLRGKVTPGEGAGPNLFYAAE